MEHYPEAADAEGTPGEPEGEGSPGEEPGPLEVAAGEQLGVGRWDRPPIFRETASAAVDNGLAYWSVLVLSGAIATLGLALDSAAVVIGAMLVAPLLAPIMGLSLALAVGDARLALQTAAVLFASLLAVVATAAALTAVLPFRTITLQISSRIHPNTLDLGIAVCSGIVGAVVTVERGQRLSAAIPGVAVAVALIPPLAVAGFGMAAGWQVDVISGSLLLLAANLAGIVLSGMLVFLLIGMHRGEVVDTAREWHTTARPRGIAHQVCRLPWARSISVFGSVTSRVLLVVAFVAVLVIPLTAALREVAREIRLERAVTQASALFEDPGRTSVLGHRLELGGGEATAHVRVVTSQWVQDAAREAFQDDASRRAGEPVALRLEQLPAPTGGAAGLDQLLGGRGDDGRVAEVRPLPPVVEEVRALITRSAALLPLPPGVVALGAGMVAGAGGADTAVVGYVGPQPLHPQVELVLIRAFRAAVGDPALAVRFTHEGQAIRPLDPSDREGLDSLASLLERYPRVHVELLTAGADSVAVAAALDALREAGVERPSVVPSGVPDGPPRVRLGMDDGPSS